MFISVSILCLRLRLSLLLLSTVAIHIDASPIASCHQPAGRLPLLSDCRYIHAHIPSLHSLRPSLMAAQTSSSPSFPFFPTADIDHASCSIALFVGDNSTLPPPVLQGAIALQIWTRMRECVMSVINTCILNQLTGFCMGEMADLTWLVLITESGLTDSHREDLRRSMEQDGPWSSDREEGDLLYSTTFYDV